MAPEKPDEATEAGWQAFLGGLGASTSRAQLRRRGGCVTRLDQPDSLVQRLWTPEPGGTSSDTFVNSLYVDVTAYTFGPAADQAVAVTAAPHSHRSLRHLHGIKGYEAIDILMKRQGVVLLAHSRWAVSLPPILGDAPSPL